MKENIANRLSALREVMRQERLGAFIFLSTDPHQSEYVADCWKGREWISGFNGSAGTAVVTMNSAALWTDSRYFLAAEDQLSGTEFQLMRLKMPDTPTVAEWIGRELRGGSSTEVGIDGMVASTSDIESLIADLRREGGLTLRTNLDVLSRIWTDRPSLPLSKAEIQPMEYAGESIDSKLKRIRAALRKEHADGMLMASLDDIAWTLNLRGQDVHCNPVVVSYLLIASDKATLFVDPRKVTAEVEIYLRSAGVKTAPYSDIVKGLKDYFEYNILVDPAEVSYTLYRQLPQERIVRSTSPVPFLKAVKNDAEIAGFHRSMIRDGVAMVKFLRWLRPAVEAGGQTELSIDEKLTSLRREQDLFRDISFDTIAAYQEHGAIVHYEATEDTNVELRPEGFLLLDSGAQYQDGTTDITRTIALGPLTDEQRLVYTLVLKGHIQLEMAKFPEGASGTQIDALAREPLWRYGLNYLHGTGHGVGAYLNVHEGPHQIRMEWKPSPLLAGMTVTDEPGVYLAGRFGVRIENTLLVKAYTHRDDGSPLSDEFGRFLQMEPLTLCPIDTEPIIVSMLTGEEIAWLNSYHSMVCERLSPYLDTDDRQWLREATKEILTAKS
ncbi:MAG: aminopeptidase P family protein [Prevotella sp.]|nr:aminopeptidase P family protein [Prevotella sp.]